MLTVALEDVLYGFGAVGIRFIPGSANTKVRRRCKGFDSSIECLGLLSFERVVIHLGSGRGYNGRLYNRSFV